MRLSELIAGTTITATAATDPVVTGLALDSRSVKAGNLFAALPGSNVDGAKFIPDAIRQGAGAILVDAQTPISELESVAILRAEDPRRALAQLAARFFTPQPETTVAVTGTSGKTSVADFTRQLWISAGRSAASIGTIGVITKNEARYGALTTPDTVTLHKTIAELAGAGVDHLAMEASSHGLDQRRLDGVRLKAAAFTNLGRDHLDYHSDMDAYLRAKLRLFDSVLPNDGTAVVFADDDYAEKFIDTAKKRSQRILRVGRRGDTVRLHDVKRDGFAQRIDVSLDGKRHQIKLGLVGDYQVSNTLVAAGLAFATGSSIDDVVSGIHDLKGVAGRLEIVGQSKGALMIIDYAHKPEALQAALSACRPFASGRLIAVFGCGGDRDKGKRPIMGSIASRDADVAIVTDDNPRTEDPGKIRQEITTGNAGLIEIGDRRAAIQKAVAMASTGDVIVVAGKGHETGQIIGSETVPFSDHDELRAAMEMASE